MTYDEKVPTALHDSASSSVNDARTCEPAGTRLTQPRSPVVPVGYTYFVRCGDAIKIGYSADPEQRIQSLRTGAPEELVVLAITSTDVIAEADAHARFAHLRTRGEWFRAEPELLDFILEINTAQDEDRPAWPNMPPEQRQIMSELHGLRIKKAGDIAVTNRISIMMGCLETLHEPEGYIGHHAAAKRNLGRARIELAELPDWKPRVSVAARTEQVRIPMKGEGA